MIKSVLFALLKARYKSVYLSVRNIDSRIGKRSGKIRAPSSKKNEVSDYYFYHFSFSGMFIETLSQRKLVLRGTFSILRWFLVA